jgi:hypothetical protein
MRVPVPAVVSDSMAEETLRILRLTSIWPRYVFSFLALLTLVGRLVLKGCFAS